MTKYEKKLEKEFNRYIKNEKIRQNRLSQWNNTKDLIYSEFKKFIKKAESDDFGKIYNTYTSKYDETVQIKFGSLPIAQSLEGNGIAIEKGGAMVYSIDPSGNVFCFIYLCSSERIEFPKKYILLQHYNEPKCITSEKIQKDILNLLMYQRVSSSIQYSSFWEKKKLQWKLCDERAFAKILNISIQTLATLIKRI